MAQTWVIAGEKLVPVGEDPGLDACEPAHVERQAAPSAPRTALVEKGGARPSDDPQATPLGKTSAPSLGDARPVGLGRADASSACGADQGAPVRVELVNSAAAAGLSLGRLEREALAQAAHAAAPFVERDAQRAVGAVVLPAGARRAAEAQRFSFVLSARVLVLIDDAGVCAPVLARMVEDGAPVEGAGGVLCALLRAPLRQHPAVLSRVRDDYEQVEELILEGRERVDRARMMADTRRLLGLDAFYQGLSDLAEDLAEEGWGVVSPGDRLRFQALSRQLDRLSARLESLQDYCLQVHGLYQEGIDVRQNNVMQWLTVVATIAMPLTFITSWYGMNFPHMALLDAPWGYPLTVGACVLIAVVEIAFFYRRGWLSFSSRPRRRRRR